MLRFITAASRLSVLAVFFFSVVLAAVAPSADAAQLVGTRYVQLSSAEVSDTSEYRISFTLSDFTTPLGSIKAEVCTNDPLPNTPCTVPAGLDLLTATLADQSGNTGFSIHPDSVDNELILTRFPVLPMSSNVSFLLDGVTNPSSVGSYYIRLLTYASDDATGSATESGGVVFSINGGMSVAAEVPPYLKFCVGAAITGYDCASATMQLLDFGEFSTNATKTATSQFVVATNAGNGFNVTVAGTTLTSGNNIIPNLTANASAAAGTSQFGLNLRANSNPLIGAEPIGPGVGTVRPNYGVVNSFRFASNESVAYGTGTTDNRKFTVSYIANIDGDQKPGIYATTLSYIALANF